VEALIYWIEKFPSAIEYWDEGNLFLNGLGLYKKNNGQMYDRAVFNNLYGGDAVFRRDLVNKRITIQSPRLNMCLLGHPSKFIEFAMEERSSKDDGLTHRFLMCSPKTHFLTKQEVLTAMNNVPFSITVLLYVVQNIVGKGLKFSLNIEAEEVFDKIFENCNAFRQKVINCENYLW
jgi:hypothetical protein